MTEEEPKVSDPTYRDSDIKIAWLIAALVLLTAVITLAFVGMRILYKQYDKKFYENQVLLSEKAQRRQLPPQPVLQVDEKSDLQAYVEHERAVMNSYQVVNPEMGLARIPINVAKQKVVQRGLSPLTNPYTQRDEEAAESKGPETSKASTPSEKTPTDLQKTSDPETAPATSSKKSSDEVETSARKEESTDSGPMTTMELLKRADEIQAANEDSPTELIPDEVPVDENLSDRTAADVVPMSEFDAPPTDSSKEEQP